MFQLGVGLIQEGISDIIKVATQGRNFNFGEYWKDKCVSLALTFAHTGLSTFINSRLFTIASQSGAAAVRTHNLAMQTGKTL